MNNKEMYLRDAVAYAQLYIKEARKDLSYTDVKDSMEEFKRLLENYAKNLKPTIIEEKYKIGIMHYASPHLGDRDSFELKRFFYDKDAAFDYYRAEQEKGNFCTIIRIITFKDESVERKVWDDYEKVWL